MLFTVQNQLSKIKVILREVSKISVRKLVEVAQQAKWISEDKSHHFKTIFETSVETQLKSKYNHEENSKEVTFV